MNYLDYLQPVFLNQNEFRHHNKHYINNINKKRRSLDRKENIYKESNIPIIISKDKILNSQPSSSDHLMLTKPFWPWP